ncbi:glycerate kinase type-2 family protein [Apibacter adventoris]|uniref:glycerate kinase type-2 family protein n=1 Tax=Apibacter adventoris TaxID=1679466 RepID=UPI000CF69D06|nr:DUF4147 domain-containing protein [Apibacter adventoris]PQL94441.1 glycerate kinase [Apibacter adventoris]
MNSIQIVKNIFKAGVESVLPDKLVRENVKLEKDILHIANMRYSLLQIDNIYVVGAGKASALMGKELETILGNHITAGHIIVKYGQACSLTYINITEAGHPIPDKQGFKATQDIITLAKKAEERDLVICLFSGGASSLLTDFPNEASPEDIIKLNEILLKSGANINEMNAVRKHVSKVKGGQLAKEIYPAQTASLILSDVVGDGLDVIASGPTTFDQSTFLDVKNIISKYNLEDEIPENLKKYIEKGVKGNISETPKIKDKIFDKVHNFIIGSNSIALEYAQKKAKDLEINSIIITSKLEGDACIVAKKIVERALTEQKQLNIGESICLLFGGETTVKVDGKGLGGRNQHLALCAARLLSGKKGIVILSAGTDGNDGPTNAAGAIVTADTIKDAKNKGLDINLFINKFDSYHFFQQVGGHYITGSTLTNVMDLIIVLIKK